MRIERTNFHKAGVHGQQPVLSGESFSYQASTLSVETESVSLSALSDVGDPMDNSPPGSSVYGIF